MKTNNFLKFIVSIIICELAGAIGLLFTYSAVPSWYAALPKPAMTPPPEVFGKVWIVLYFLIGLSLFLVWKKRTGSFGGPRNWDMAMTLFFVQLLLNAVWAPIFFGLKNPQLAFFELAALLVIALITLIVFFRVSVSAAILFIPYFLWLVFAAYLNFSVWQMSKGSAAPAAPVAAVIPADWLTATDATSSATFRYPQDFGTTFLHAFDWPPALQILSQPFSCTEGGSEIMQAGQTSLETIGGSPYCVTKESEGAAGSIYTNYAYAFPFQGETAILTFTVRFVQCANYDEPSSTLCTNERSAFDIDGIMGKVAQSLTRQ